MRSAPGRGTMDRVGGNRGWRGVATPVALFLLALAVRALPLRTVLVDDRVYPFGNDSYYHLRRILYSVIHFPAVLEFDPYINHPDGARPIWTPLFDWAIALVVRPFVGDPNLERLERIVVWVPPLLGAATVVALYLLVRRVLEPPTAALAGLLLAVLSGHFWYSQLGFVDHHAAVALTATLVLAAGLSLLGERGDGVRRPRGVALGFSVAGALLVWPGSLLHVGLVEAGLLVFLLSRPSREEASDFARRLALAHAVAFLLVLPFGATGRPSQWGPFSPVVLSGFQPWLLGSLALFALGCATAWGRSVLAETRRGRLAGAVGLAALLAIASVMAFPGLLAGAGDAWRWLAKEESFQAWVGESQPLFVSRGRFDVGTAVMRLSGFVFLVPVALCVLAWRARRERERASHWLLLGWCAGLAAVTLLQRRFFNSFSVALALLMAWSLTVLWQSLPASVLGAPVRRATARVALALLALALLWPTLCSYGPFLEQQWGALRSSEVTLPQDLVMRRVLTELAIWLSLKTPPTEGWMDLSRRAEYGVMAPWDMGHVIQHVGRRPTVTDNFGDDLGERNFRLARLYYQSGERAATDLLDRLRVRYVIAGRNHGFLGEAPVDGSMFLSLYYLDGRELQSPENRADIAPVPALERHRLVYESRLGMRSAPQRSGFFKIFEYVPGALLRGRAAPGARLRVTLPLRTNRGREFVYETGVDADETGRYRVRLPYSNRGSPPSTRVAAHYTIRCRGEDARFVLDESAVTSGTEVTGPDLCLPRAARSPPAL